jgi:hypothetical protein
VVERGNGTAGLAWRELRIFKTSDAGGTVKAKTLQEVSI